MNGFINTVTIAKSILHLREEKGLSQEEFGDLIGCTARTVRRYERDGVKDVEIINFIAQACKTDAFSILRGC